MARIALLAAAIIGLGFPAGLGLAVYLASGSTLAPPAVSARVPTGPVGRPSLPPVTTDTTTTDGTTTGETTTDGTTTEETTTDETTTESDTTTTETTDSSGDSSGKGRGRGRGRGRGGDD